MFKPCAIVADADLPTRELLVELLNEEGWTVYSFEAAPDLNAIAQLSPELAILDLHPAYFEDVLRLVDQLQSSPAISNPAIMLSCTNPAIVAWLDRRHSQQHRAALLKPFDLDTFHSSLQRLVQNLC
jgi:CheY-like chemotaxis protein